MTHRVKVCGITRVEDALAAAELGADAVGLIFVPESPRRVRPSLAAEIVQALPPFVTKVGVFVNELPERVNERVARVGLDCVQFHGEESPETCARSSAPWYKAFRVGEGFDLDRLRAYRSAYHLLDAYDPGRRGGTGMAMDWSIAAQAAREFRIILSGGLNPENAGEAVGRAGPRAIDVNSGVESRPGVKDHDAMARLFDGLRRAGYRR